MLLAPPEVNLIWQNDKVERLLRRLFTDSQDLSKSASEPVSLRLRAASTSHDRGLAGGAALAGVQYDFSIQVGAEPPIPFGRIAFSVDPPPRGKVSEIKANVFPPFTSLTL
jgi:hypothetical protein